jgi:hypothetical protein
MNNSAATGSAGPYWEPWLALWRTGALFLVEPWDNALHAFAGRAQLLPRRLDALGLDPAALARLGPSVVSELVERCIGCESPEQCEWDLRQNPAGSAWRSYCPNAAKLLALAMDKTQKVGDACGVPR